MYIIVLERLDVDSKDKKPIGKKKNTRSDQKSNTPHSETPLLRTGPRSQKESTYMRFTDLPNYTTRSPQIIDAGRLARYLT